MRGPVDAEYATGRRLRWWSRVWRYALVAVMAITFYIATYGGIALLPDAAVLAREHMPLVVLTFVDPLVGLAAICVLPLRRRHPFAIAMVTGLAMSVSTSAGGAAALAAVSLATHRRAVPIVVVGLIWGAGMFVFGQFMPEDLRSSTPLWGHVLSWIIVYGLNTAVGLYIGARRALIASLHDRALEAERERELQVAAAQAGERTRIAREMHDVLAHRISLVAMHAGALAYRDDLDRDDTRRAADLIQQNARRALAELRQVLGVLRAADGGVEPPQPTLAQLPGLLDEARAAGAEIALDGSADPPELISRTAYRVIQEALTNARKHAPGAPIRVRIGGDAGGLLAIEVENGRPAPTLAARPAEGTGSGLTGLVERVELAGGTMDHGPSGVGFAVRAWLPWEVDEQGEAA